MMSAPMPQYQKRDESVVDYELFSLDDFPYMLRGPAPSGAADISIIGAGQSFGVLVRTPYHHMLRDAGFEIMNLSVGGSAPKLYLNHEIPVAECNKSKMCIVQVLSARSTDNAYFETMDGKNMLRPRGSALPFIPGDAAFQALFANEPISVAEMVIESMRSNWVSDMKELLGKISVPKIVLWLSKRSPDNYAKRYASYRQASGVFPQFINREMIDAILPYMDDYVEVVSSRGVPNKLTDKDTGEPTTVLLGDRKIASGEDAYYPSPEMHEDAFERLLPAVKKLLGS